MLKQYFLILILVFFLTIQMGSSLDCKPGSYEVQTIDPNKTYCDNCGRKIPTPCATVKCAAGTECKLIEDCVGGKFIIRPICKPKCRPISLRCLPPAVITEGVDGCPFCYYPEDGFVNPCRLRGACQKNESCHLQEVTCVTVPCYPVSKCCPIDVCLPNSLRYTDCNGCKRCYGCNECEHKICPRGYRCVLQEVICCRPCFCPPKATCVQIFPVPE